MKTQKERCGEIERERERDSSRQHTPSAKAMYQLAMTLTAMFTG